MDSYWIGTMIKLFPGNGEKILWLNLDSTPCPLLLHSLSFSLSSFYHGYLVVVWVLSVKGTPLWLPVLVLAVRLTPPPTPRDLQGPLSLKAFFHFYFHFYFTLRIGWEEKYRLSVFANWFYTKEKNSVLSSEQKMYNLEECTWPNSGPNLPRNWEMAALCSSMIAFQKKGSWERHLWVVKLARNVLKDLNLKGPQNLQL